MDGTLPQAVRHKNVIDLHTWADGRAEMSLFGKNGSFSLDNGDGPIPLSVTLYDLYRQPLGSISLRDDGEFEGWYYERQQSGNNLVKRSAVKISTSLKPEDKERKKPKAKKKRRKKA